MFLRIFRILFFFIWIFHIWIEIDALTASNDTNSNKNHTDFCFEDGNCTNKLSSSNQVNLSALGLDNEIDGKSIGINVQALGNLTEIEEILTNDTGLELLANTSILDDRKAVAGSYILPILKKHKYDMNAPPLIIEGVPVQVKFGVHIISLSDFKSAEMQYTALVQLRMQWRDVRLKHMFTPYILIKEKNITDQIWRPDPYFVNEKDVELFGVTFPNMRMSVFPDGLVNYVIRLRLVPACQMSFCRFPQDRQKCDLKISSMAYPKEIVEFTWFDSDPVEMAPDIRLPELQLISHSWEYCLSQGNIVKTSCLRIVFDLQRSVASHILRKFMPSFAALLFAWAGAYVPQHFQDIRVVAPVTILITLKQLQRSNDDLPTTSYLTSMDIWFTVVETFTILALMETMLIYGVSRRVKAYKKLAKHASSPESKQEFEDSANRAERYANILDYSSRFLFPVLFALFAVLYATVVAKGQQDYCVHNNNLN